MRKLVTAAAAAAAVLSVPAIAPSIAAAEGPPVTITINSNAILQPDGSALLTFTYSCLPGFGTGTTGTISTDLEQSQGLGFGSATAICDDQSHTLTLDQSPGPFTLGEAAAQVQIITGFNETGDVQREVTVVKP